MVCNSENSSDNKYLCKHFNSCFKIYFEPYVINNLRSTALLLENYDSLLDTVI